MAFADVGIRAVVENYQGFNKAVDAINARIADVGKKAQAAAQQNITLNKALAGVTAGANKFAQAVGGVPGPVGAAAAAVNNIAQQIGFLPPQVQAAVAAITALVTAFVALGTRGAAYRGIIESFDRLTRSIGVLGTTLLEDLRNASAGTVADMDLLRMSNVALAGAVGKFGQEFGTKLPKILEIARVQARATGQSVDYLFNSLIMGIKRGSPLLIDNTGLVLKVSQAQQDYAKSIGKSVEQLTSEEKQIALLNATLAAGETAIRNLGDLHETAAEKIARAQATITNMADRLALAVQPAFEQILDVLNRFLSSVSEIVNGLAPIIGGIISIITQAVTNVLDSIGIFLEPFKDMLVSILPYLAILVEGIQKAFAIISGVVKAVFGGIVKFITDIAKNLFGIDVENLGKNFFEGAASIFGSFANGIAAAANALIFPAVIGIAQFIADLLVGQSPPPKGPLSKIDKGGANTMLAWLDGFLGVSLQPVSEVIAEVNAAMGSIGQMSLKQVEARLAGLDNALIPFQNRLDIVKSQFEAISAPAQAALNAIDRQLEAANEALLRGEAGAAERVRALDMQRQTILDTLDAQQAQVDNAEIQLALMKALQGQERTLLNIRKERIGTPIESKLVTLPDGTKVKALKEKDASGTIPETPVSGGIGLPGDATEFPTLDELMGQLGIDEAKRGIAEAFLRPLLESGELQKFAANQGLLQKQLNRMGDLGSATKGIAGAFNSIGKIFDLNDPTSPLAIAKRVVTELFDPASPNSINAVLTKFGDSLANLPVVQNVKSFFNGIFDTTNPDSVLSKVKTSVEDLFDPNSENNLQSILTRFGTSLSSITWDDVQDFFDSVFDLNDENSTLSKIKNAVEDLFDPISENSINALLTKFGNSLENLPLVQKVRDFFNGVFDSDIEGSPAQVVKDKVDSIVNPDRIGSVPYTLMHLGDTFTELDVSSKLQTFFDGIFNPDTEGSPAAWVKDKLDALTNPTREGSIPYALSHLGDGITDLDLGGKITDALSGISDAFDLNDPESALSKVKSTVEDLFDPTSPTGLSTIISNFGTNLSTLPVVGDVLNFFNSIFSTSIVGSPAQLLMDMVDGIINPTREGSIPFFFSTLPAKVADAAVGLWTELDTKVFAPVRNFMTGEGEGTLQGILATVVMAFTNLPANIVGALKDLGTQLWNAVAVPVIGLMNSIIEAIENTIRSVQSAAGDLVKNVAAAYGTAIALFMGEAEGTKRAQEFMAAFGAIYAPVSLGRISTVMPDILNSPDIKSSGSFGGAAMGGLFGGGLLRVGERGEELVASANKLAVFPHEFVRAMDMLAQVMAQPAPMPVMAGGVDNRSYNDTINANFYGVQNGDSAMRRFAAMQAMRR